MTHRGWWLFFFALGTLVAQLIATAQPNWSPGPQRLLNPALTWLALTVLLWLVIEWIKFAKRLLWELPKVTVERTVNGRSDGKGYLWAGRKIQVQVRINAPRGLAAQLTFKDCVPENTFPLRGANKTRVLTDEPRIGMEYEAWVGSPGRITLPGVRVILQDTFGLFVCERFLPCEATYKVLPSFNKAGDMLTVLKRSNSIPQHGIHRLQQAGLGAELLELREYTPGDPPKSIAWKVSARREMLMTRQFESEVPVRLQLFMDGSISTRLGGFGHRLIDQMAYVAASVAQTANSVGDPVGATLFDERGKVRVTAGAGEKNFYQLLEALSNFCHTPPPPKVKFNPLLFNAVYKLCEERYPDLLETRVNRLPFSLGAMLNARRLRAASVLGEVYQLSASNVVDLVYNNERMARFCQRFLQESGVAWMEPLLENRQTGFHDGLTSMELLSQSLQTAIARARDNEVFVIMANLLECSGNLSGLIPAVRAARARHHRVAIVAPTPIFQRPDLSKRTLGVVSVEGMLNRAEDLRTIEFHRRLKAQMGRLGVPVSLSGEEEAIRTVLAEIEIARSGRSSRAGAIR